MRKKRGQSSIEFVLISAFLLFAVFGFLSFISSTATDYKEESNEQIAQDIAEFAYKEIDLSRSLNDGYTRVFILPATVNGVDYNITLIGNRELIADYLGYEFIKFLPANVTGNITKGYNAIQKKDGKIVLNSGELRTYLLRGNGSGLDCQVTNACPYTTIFRMSYISNAHAEMPNSSNYQYKVCCRNPNHVINNSCENGVTLLKLHAKADAHVEKAGLENYQYRICLSSETTSINCDYTTLDCKDAGYTTCVATISSDTNAHVSDCITNPYPTRICCR